MTSQSQEDVLPVLVAELADEDARDVLERAAASGTRVLVPLQTAPVSTSKHVLEVHLPHAREPFFFLALPLGPPTEDGFPLRILPSSPPATRAPTSTSQPVASGILRGRRPPTMAISAMSESHAADLSQAGPLPTGEDALVGRALAGGKLMIEQLIGRGGVGAVYKARHRELRMPVAVKVLHESFQRDIDFCRRFYAEALAASRLDHPNITRVIDFGQEPDGLLYLAMEFLDGMELRAVLDQEGALPAERIALVMMQTCAGLSHAHARGIVHRDIKPENLVLVRGLDDDGQPTEIVKVCDFGIAQHRGLPTTEDQGVIAGTPEYMSPEQCRGDELDARSDVYACGVVLYELATGQVPFISDRPQSILNKHQFTSPLPPTTIRPGVDANLERVVLHALEKEVDDRPQSMRDLRAELKALLHPPAVDAAVVQSSSRGSQTTRAAATVEEFRPMTSAQAAVVLEAVEAKTPAPEPPDWLERGGAYAGYTGPTSTPATTTPRKPPPLPTKAKAVGESQSRIRASAPIATPGQADELADALSMNTASWIRRLNNTTDVKAFTQFALRLEPTLRTLASRKDVKTLWAISSTLHGIAMEGSHVAGSRAQIASRVVRVFEDPTILGFVAERLLSSADEERDHARRLLVHAGVFGAYGLYGARVKLASDPVVRAPFCATLKDFGPKAWPVVRAALEKLLEGEQSTRAMELAEDLLLCVTMVGDESAGHLVVKYLRSTNPGVCRAAVAAIVVLWKDRAKPLLVGMLQSKDDTVRIAGIAGLRQLGGIDEHVVPRLQAVLLRRLPASEELRAAAALALAHVSETAQKPALSLLAQVLTPPRDGREPRTGESLQGGLSREDAVVLAAARSILTLGGKNYRGLVAERAERSPDALKGQLKRLLLAS